MSNVVNLRTARKQQARQKKEKQATENRAAHGRTKAEKKREALTQARAEQHLDGVKREPPKQGDD